MAVKGQEGVPDGYKRCSKCGEVKEVVEFRKDDYNKCKQCVKERRREYRHKNADKIREQSREYQLKYYYANKEHILEKQRGYSKKEWEEKKEIERMDIEMRRILAREKELEKKRVYARERYKKKAEEIKAYHVKYRKENKEKVAEYNKKYQVEYQERTGLINSAKWKLKRRGINPDENKELLESIMLQTRLKRVIKTLKSHKEVTNG